MQNSILITQGTTKTTAEHKLFVSVVKDKQLQLQFTASFEIGMYNYDERNFNLKFTYPDA